MRVFLLNDTSNWHCGSAAATAVLCRLIEQAGGEVVGRLATNDKGPLRIDVLCEADAVVVNGEGSLHHDNGWATHLMFWMGIAKGFGVPVAVVNALWCEMGEDARAVLQQCDLVTFRERYSRDHAQMPDAPIFPDLALLADYPQTTPPAKPGHRTQTAVPRGDEATWAQFIGELRNLAWLPTSQHHGILAAGIADVQVEVTRRPGKPTWKNRGLMDYWVPGGSLHDGLMAQRERMQREYPELLRSFFARARVGVPA